VGDHAGRGAGGRGDAGPAGAIERVNAGLARAKAKGTVLGRRRTAPAVEKRIRSLRAKGIGILKIGRTLGIGTSVLASRLGDVKAVDKSTHESEL